MKGERQALRPFGACVSRFGFWAGFASLAHLHPVSP